MQGAGTLMARECDEMTLLLNEPLDGEGEDLVLERPDLAMERVAGEASVGDEEPAPQLHALEPTPCDQASVPTVPGETPASGPADRDGNELASSSATAPQDAASFSRGLVDTYFRQMGDAAWLSREEEIALAKRIEAAQRAMLTGLCRVPMLDRANRPLGARGRRRATAFG